MCITIGPNYYLIRENQKTKAGDGVNRTAKTMSSKYKNIDKANEEIERLNHVISLTNKENNQTYLKLKNQEELVKSLEEEISKMEDLIKRLNDQISSLEILSKRNFEVAFKHGQSISDLSSAFNILAKKIKE